MPGFYEEKIFSRLCDVLMKQFEDVRPRLIEQARGRVLEIGLGSGHNLPFYREAVTELVAVEPSPGMTDLAKKRIAHCAFPVRVVQGSAEKIPEPAGSFDTVVSTFTFCTIADPLAAAQEARRVLKPGGRFLFLEHVVNPGPKVALWQRRLNPLWKRAFCGCELHRDTWGILEKAGFNLSAAKRINVEAPAIVRHLIVGTATAS